MSSEGTVVYSNSSPGILTRWLVSVGANVEEGALLAEFEGQADHSWKVDELLAKKGTLCTFKTPLLRVTACLHDIQFAGMCASCGKDLTVATAQGPSKLSSVSIIHGQPRLTITMQEAQRVDKETAERLLKQKKLSLVLDLDHTLIHAATETHFQQFAVLHKIDPKAEELHQFLLPGSSMNYFVKLRPHLKEFLQVVSSLFELHMYTFGTRMYALKVAQIIDPNNHIFKERILSRDDCGDIDHKTLKRIFPCDDSMVVIVDDREDVWKKSKNLVRIEPFLYFVGLPEVNPHPFDKQPHHPQAPPQHPHAPPQHPHAPHHPHAPPHPGAPALPPTHRQPPSRRPPSRRNPHPPPPSHAPISNGHRQIPTLTSTSTKVNADSDKPEKMEIEKEVNQRTETTNGNEKEAEKEMEKTPNTNENKSDAANQDNKQDEGNTTTQTDKTVVQKTQHDSSNESNGDAKMATNDSNAQPQNGQENHQATEKEQNKTEHPNSTEPETQIPGDGKPPDAVAKGEIQPQTHAPPHFVPPPWPPPPDECLPIILDVLREVHRRFYALHDSQRPCDVKDIIADMKRDVLAGCFVVFSGFYPREVDPRVTPLGRLAESFGAVCQLDLNKTTTHLIAKKNHTDKVKTANARRITIVTENWLFASTRRWKRANENEYFLPPDENQPMESIVKPDVPVDVAKPDIHRPTKDRTHTNGKAHTPAHVDHKNPENGHKRPKQNVPKDSKETYDLPYPQMVPKKSLLDEMKQEAEEMFGEDGEDLEEEEGEEQDYDEDREDEHDEDGMEDEMEEDEDDTPKKSKGLRHLMGSKRKRDIEIVDDDDFASFLESELGNQ